MEDEIEELLRDDITIALNKHKEPPKCVHCQNDDISMMDIEHRQHTTTIFCKVCGKSTIINEK